MSLKLEIGKEYVTRGGERVKVTGPVDALGYDFEAKSVNGIARLYTSAGRLWPDGEEDRRDIVGEWPGAIEINQLTTEPAAPAPPWIKWDGSSTPPVAKDVLVEAELRYGSSRKAPAGNFYWSHSPQEHAHDIVRYRVVPSPPTIENTPEMETFGPLPDTGRKADEGKARFELLPGDALASVAEIFTFGAAKYGDRNWEKGLKWSRVFGALQRHLWAWHNREGVDPETGKSHLWHAACCVLFLIAYEIRGTGEDDRPHH